MSLRLAQAGLAILVLAASFVARAEAPQPTPIKTYADATGKWVGEIDLGTRVVMVINAQGDVDFVGPHDLTGRATLKDDRLYISSHSTDLDCGLLNEVLACHARFGRMYAELSLRKWPWVTTQDGQGFW